MAWNTTGDLLATGSNDKTIKMMRFNCDNCELEGGEAELTMHDGTIRDMCFMEDLTNRSSLLISGGAGDCKIYVTDCDTATPFQALSGHSGIHYCDLKVIKILIVWTLNEKKVIYCHCIPGVEPCLSVDLKTAQSVSGT